MPEDYKLHNDCEDGSCVPSAAGEVIDASTMHDEVFGEISEDSPNYRNLGWRGTVVLMMKTQLGLGVLSIPAVFDTVGIVPGVILVCVIGGITTWSDYMVGVFKLKHRGVYGVDDVGGMLAGRIGREVLGGSFCLYFIFGAGSAMISISIALNALSDHGACTAIFVGIAAIVGFVFASLRTLGRLSWLAWFGVSSIVISVMTVTVAVGFQERPWAAPREGPWTSDYRVINHPSFTDAMSSISSLIFAYAGTPAFFNIAAEMREPRDYTKALIVCQTLLTAIYITVGTVVYYFCGSYVSSPALGSAGPLLKRVCYGLALPGLLVAVTLMLHFASKFVFVRLLRGSKHLTANTVTHWISWLGCTLGSAVIAYLIASGIPIFGELISLIGALFGTLLAFQPMGGMWLYDNWAEGRVNTTPRWCVGVCWSAFVVVLGTFFMVAGTYSSVVGIMSSLKETGSTSGWSCVDNSNTA